MFLAKLKLTSFYFIVIFVSHLIMFILMTYNLGIILASLFGDTFGFFLFGLREEKKKVESCCKILENN